MLTQDPLNLDFEGVRYQVFYAVTEDCPQHPIDITIVRRCDQKPMEAADFANNPLRWNALYKEAQACAQSRCSSYEDGHLTEEVLEF